MEVEVDSVVSTPENRNQFNEGIFCSNYPNPFTNSTQFKIQLAYDTKVIIQIHHVNGQMRDELNPGYLSKGTQIINYQNTKLEPGIYVYKIIASGQSFAGKIMVKP